MTANRFVTVVLWLAGRSSLAVGICAFVDPHVFYDNFAEFPPYNRHFLHDIGAFEIGIGVSLLLALRWSDAAFATLAGAGVGASVHAFSHIIDHDLGGDAAQTIVFVILAALLLAAAAARWNAANAPR